MEVTFYSSSYSSILNILDCEKKKKKKNPSQPRESMSNRYRQEKKFLYY